jgi:transposase
LTAEDRTHFERVAGAATSAQRDALRARVILAASAGSENIEIAADLGLHPDTVGRWRKRFRDMGPKGLRDAPRSGRPPRFTAVQKAQVLQKAIEAPRENDVPITHWSKTSLARLAVEAGIADAIHPSTVWRWLNKADLKPHQHRIWLKSTDPDFDLRMRDVVGVYLSAPAWAQEDVVVFSVDEKTSIQALERSHPDTPMRPGKPARREHEYIRHGTTCLTAGFNVATGEVTGVLTPDRPAPVFAAFIRNLCASVPDAPKIHIVLDQLNTHWHHDVCKVVAEMSGIAYDPEQHKHGADRRTFLLDPAKRVVFHFTPKHASWLNQIEIWFSTLSRNVLARGSFDSNNNLKSKIREFVAYYNRVLAHPYQWTYTGMPCRE